MVQRYLTERYSLKSGLGHVFLDANEHYRQWVKIPESALRGLNRYPDITASELRQEISQYHGSGLEADNYLITAGSIEAIDMIMSTERVKSIAINTPTYDVYSQRAAIHKVNIKKVPLNQEGQPDVRALTSLHNVDALILLNPNNPTGHLIKHEVMKTVLKSFGGLIVVDEAYIEYAGIQNSILSYIRSHRNLIILRTFSKAWGLAGMRLGYIIGEHETIDSLKPYQRPYSVNLLALQAGIAALQQADKLELEVDTALWQKALMIDKFHNAGVRVRDTSANFFLIESDEIDTMHSKLTARGYLVRKRPLSGETSNCIRVAIGAPHENQSFFTAFMEAARG